MTIRFLADENFNNRIILGLRRRDESIDIALVQEVVALAGVLDPRNVYGVPVVDGPCLNRYLGPAAGR